MKKTAKKFIKRALALAFLLFAVWFWQCLPEELFDKPRASVLLDRDGQLLAARIADDGQWRFAEGDSLPERFVTALTCFEDRDFYEHLGVSPKALLRATYQNIQAGKVVSGGSTLSMQVVRLSRDNPSRSYFEKFTELFRALRLELRYDKNEILSYYCTHAPMGGNVVGVETASWRYFNRSPHSLSWAEAATLAVLPNAPSLIFPGKNHHLLEEKRNRLLHILCERQHIDSLTLELSLEEPLPDQPLPLPQLSMHLLQHLEKNHGEGQRFTSTVHRPMQASAERVVEQHYKGLKNNLVHNAAALIIDAKTGEVMTYIGNTPSGEHGSHVDIVQAPRSPGSSLKPFLYAASLDEGLLSPEELLPDIPINIGGFSPKNFSDHYYGAVKADEALARSLNIPFVVQLKHFGLAPFHSVLRSLSFKQMQQSSSHYGLSLILGGGECTLYELAGAWYCMNRTLFDYHDLSGQYRAGRPELHCLKGDPAQGDFNITPQAPFFSAAAVHTTFGALKKVRRPDDAMGWEQMSGSDRISWKTGTSYGFRDAWAIGTSGDFIVAVWVGNADGTGRPGVIGTSAAAPLMFSLFSLLPESEPLPVPYDDLTELQVCKYSGQKAGPFCSETTTRYWPAASAETANCKYHQPIHLSADGRFRSYAACDHSGSVQAKFVLSPVQAYYYKQSHPEYEDLPEWLPACRETGNTSNTAIIHPAEGSRIKMVKNLNGEINPIIAEAICQSEGLELYWHLNETYLGSTRNIHQMSLLPSSGGKQQLMVVDDSGEIERIEFEVTLVE